MSYTAHGLAQRQNDDVSSAVLLHSVSVVSFMAITAHAIETVR
jgi:hypothetical protein